MNTLTVCLLTAGKGSRMGSIGRNLNKALLPIDGKATISHIINKFPSHTDFVIGLGYLGYQVRQYLQIAHSDRLFKFVEVDNFEGPGSGPGYSLLCCCEFLQKPFYFVSCDTLWDNTLDFSLNENWLGISPIDRNQSSNYCNLKVVDNLIVDLRDKITVTEPGYQAFVGLCFIHDYPIFWRALENNNLVAGEHQISNGIKALIEQSNVIPQKVNWNDVGDSEKYKKMVSHFENYDFSKTNEAIYIIDGKVIKFFVDAKVTEQRVAKSKLNPSVFPEITNHQGQFYSYDFQSGETLYKINNQAIFGRLLDFLVRDLWLPRDVNSEKMRFVCNNFYYVKTMQRLSLYALKYPEPDVETNINGRTVPSTANLLALVPWGMLEDGIPSFIHGDLQFDNILYDQETGLFKLLDWRQDFGGQIEFGDLYYDLAKLYGGIVLNYDFIKLNLLTYSEESGDIFMDFAQRFQTENYLQIFIKFINDKGYDLARVKLLVSLIYLNMSPLHHYPFDKLLYSLGRQMLDDGIKGLKSIDD
jgi:NDP-sugar pyrophosphorylase family protein